MNFDPFPSEFYEEPATSGAVASEFDDVAQTSRVPQVDQERLMALTNELERDIALIEGAMAHLELREFAPVNAAIDVLDGHASA